MLNSVPFLTVMISVTLGPGRRWGDTMCELVRGDNGSLSLPGQVVLQAVLMAGRFAWVPASCCDIGKSQTASTHPSGSSVCVNFMVHERRPVKSRGYCSIKMVMGPMSSRRGHSMTVRAIPQVVLIIYTVNVPAIVFAGDGNCQEDFPIVDLPVPG